MKLGFTDTRQLLHTQHHNWIKINISKALQKSKCLNFSRCRSRYRFYFQDFWRKEYFVLNIIFSQFFVTVQGHKWTLKSLWRHFDEQGIDHTVVWDKIKDLMIKTVISAENSIYNLFEQNVSSRLVQIIHYLRSVFVNALWTLKKG